MNAAQLINQDSGNTEWYTPSEIIEAARLTMGSIDLDPASCDTANARVCAGRYFTQVDDGLSQPWFGNVWMNHPFGSNNRLWISKLVSEYEAVHISQACCICFASTSERWFQPLLAYPVCFVSPRVNYLLADGTKAKGVTKGSCVTYLGRNVGGFAAAFHSFGRIMVPYSVTAKCDICGNGFVAGRADARYCGPSCRQRARRQRAKE